MASNRVTLTLLYCMFFVTRAGKHPPQVTDLAITTPRENFDIEHQPFKLHVPVDIRCVWTDGYPDTIPRLFDRNLNLLGLVTLRGNTIHYRYPAIRCQDAGVIRCEAAGATQNQTHVLLVECPPLFDETRPRIVNVTQSSTTDIQFPVRAHNKSIVDCKLTMFQCLYKTDATTFKARKNTGQRTRNCTSSSSLTGVPPELTLTVRLDDVTSDDGGQWRLELTNDVATGHVDFVLHVKEREDTSQATEDTSDGDITNDEDDVVISLNLMHAIPIIASVGLVFLILIVVVIVLCKKKGSAQYACNTGQTTRDEELPPPAPELLRGFDVRPNVYHDPPMYMDTDIVTRTPGAPSASHNTTAASTPATEDGRTYDRPSRSQYDAASTGYAPLQHVYSNFRQLSGRLSQIFSRD